MRLLLVAVLLCSCTPNAEAVVTSPHKAECERVGQRLGLYRCENKEVVCYVTYSGGVDCFLKPKDSEPKDRKE
jgi:hypothetical protein